MTNLALRSHSIWILKANFVIWTINALLLVILILSGSTLNGLALSRYFSIITLLETGIAFIVGGALAYSGSVLPSKAKECVLKSDEKWSMEKLKKSEKKANKYIILAAVLLVESILISSIGV